MKPEDTEEIGARLAMQAKLGDIFLLEGELGAGKTTLVRGFIQSLGYTQAVRSPTFGILQTFDTSPPVLHADLYRLTGWQGLGIEDYLNTHISLVEWAERSGGLVSPEEAWHIQISVDGDTRVIRVTAPTGVS